VLSLKGANPWNAKAGVAVLPKAPKKKKLKYGLTHEELDAKNTELVDFIEKYF
jgi:hypothetical protein